MGHLCAPEPGAGLIGNKANFDSESNRPRRRALASSWVLVFLVLFGLATRTWSQQASLPSSIPVQILVAGAALPDAPAAQVSSSQQMPSQPSQGSIHGVVVDRDGSVCEGVHIGLTQLASNAQAVRSVISDSNGRFEFADVPPGDFKLTISSNGFATQVISGVLNTGESYDAQSIVLRVSTAATEVHVTASSQEIALEQLRQEEKQRLFGVIPNFYVTYVPNAPPLTPKRKFELALKSSADPVTFALTGAWAGIQQGNDSFSGYGQGAQGYAKRYAANYADGFIGTMIGSAILPSLLKQDPRYFYKGTGTVESRALYAIAMSVVCKGDTGHWQPNYSAILGGLAAGGISNLYYPASDRDGVTLTFENALFGVAGSAATNLFQEFLSHKLTPKIPNYGSPQQ
ncbi:MAG TPA: carboxypeptidase-like regulatory domain-containing protein [Silvibacterium sp.]|nr:carboxypeptidase-like regulatory domain-containing protein [Silvibacterium sp.]